MDLFNTQSVTFEQPTAMLRACHGKVQRFCGQLNMLEGYLKQHGYNNVADQSIAQIRHYFNVAAPLHHQDEEEDFFPLLLRHAPEARPLIQALEAEHDTLHRNWDELNQHLASLADGIPLNPELIARFTAGYDFHIPREEQLFKLGEQKIPQAELQAIGKRMAARRQG
ncbi:cation-binding protein [Eikenella longinqua]|uniref:Cation-binding protein n=1 Tax=Eikenella longinqua TaxID=1795827 RepID=A0A1A9RW32_9NEIS|nr:hemerythrin domain-containing protein [Eikenella longinqua]OAM26653.1 cation-binding protein [Eikenella longinqua]